MRVLRSTAYTIAFYLVTALFLTLGSPLLLTSRRLSMMGLRLHGRISNWLLRVIAGTKAEIRGRENLPNGPCLIVAKHQSAWETFALIPEFRDPAIVLKQELAQIPVYGAFCRKFEHIIVDRDGGPRALKAMVKEAQARVAENREILIFAEGTRVMPGAPPDYKPGFTALYQGLDVPCVPVALNSGLFWPPRSHTHYPGTIVVQFGEPLPPGLPRRAFRESVVAKIEQMTADLIRETAAQRNPPPTAVAAILRLDQR